MRPLVTFGVGLFLFFAGSSGEGDALRFLPAFLPSDDNRTLLYAASKQNIYLPSGSIFPFWAFFAPARRAAHASTMQGQNSHIA